MAAQVHEPAIQQTLTVKACFPVRTLQPFCRKQFLLKPKLQFAFSPSEFEHRQKLQGLVLPVFLVLPVELVSLEHSEYLDPDCWFSFSNRFAATLDHGQTHVRAVP